MLTLTQVCVESRAASTRANIPEVPELSENSILAVDAAFRICGVCLKEISIFPDVLLWPAPINGVMLAGVQAC